MGRRQNESIATCVPQLNRHAVCRLRLLKSVIYAAATHLIDGIADWATLEDSAVYGFDSCNGSVGELLVLGRIGNNSRARVAVWVHPELRVRVNVHVELHAFACCDAVKLSLQQFCLNTVGGRWALEILCTRVCGCSSAIVPMVRPVAVDIGANAACRWCALPVLTPQAVVGLSVGEAIWIDDGEDVEVVGVLEACNGWVRGSEELVCRVLDRPIQSAIVLSEG